MGIVSKLLSQSNNMKFLLVLAVAAYAKAEAEADPGFVYSVGHAPLVYHHAPLAYHHVPLVYAAAAEDDAVVSVEKREATAEAEAEADPEADPWLAYYGLGYAAHPYGYGYHLGYSGYLPYSYGYHGVGCRNGYGALVPCAGR